MPLKAPHRGPSLPSTHRPVPSRSVGPDSHSNVIIPLLSVLSCGHSDRAGEAGKGVPVLISEAASFLGYGHDNLVSAVPGKCPAMASVLRTEPLRAHVVPVFGGRLCHSRMWRPGPLPTRCRLETRPMGGAGRRGMMGGAESACVLLPSLSVFLDDSAKLPGPDPAADSLPPSASHSFTPRTVALGRGARWWPPGRDSLATVAAGMATVRSPKGSQRREIIRRKNCFYRGKI